MFISPEGDGGKSGEAGGGVCGELQEVDREIGAGL